jgi:hypothetical protein
LVDKETINHLLNEYEGELLVHDDDNYSLKVSYSRGPISLFSKLEFFIMDRTKFSIVDGKIKISQKEFQKSFEFEVYRNFIPLLELTLRCNDIPPDTLEELKENIINGLYSFVRLKDDRVEMLVISAGNLEKKGVFYYPDQEAEAITLIELEENTVRIYKENFTKFSEL